MSAADRQPLLLDRGTAGDQLSRVTTVQGAELE